MKRYLFDIALFTLAITIPCFAIAQNAASSVIGNGADYTVALNGQVQSQSEYINTQLQKYDAASAALLDDMSKVKQWGYRCSAFGGHIAKAIDGADSTVKADTDTMNSKLQPLTAALQTTASDGRSPASEMSQSACLANFQSGISQMDVLSATLTTTQASLRNPVGNDLATAQKNLQSHDGQLKSILAPSDRCPEQASEDYNNAKHDFAQMSTAYLAIESALAQTTSFIVAKKGTFSVQQQSCANIAQQ